MSVSPVHRFPTDMNMQRFPIHMRHDLSSLAATLLFAAAAVAAEGPPSGPLAALVPVPSGPSPTWTVSSCERPFAAQAAMIADDPAAICFAPDADPDAVAAFHAAMDAARPRSNPVDHWTTTAHGATGPEGAPIILTYSFVPDGTSIPQSSWSAGGASRLHDFMDDLYGAPDVWMPLFHQTFERWSALTGVTFVYEPNDDGAPLSSNSPGVLGVRGDVRLSAVALDGNGNILAYNYYPNFGDMVLDAGDTWYNTTTNDSRRLRNVIAHEAGHGLGLDHVCPLQQTKLMEPFLATTFDGPQHDDIRGVQHLYGDTAEPDDSPTTAFDLGELPRAPVLIGAPPPPALSLGAVRSLVRAGDEDWLRFTLDAPSTLLLTLVPIGGSYFDADQECPDQSGECCREGVTNSRTVSDLNLQVLDAAGGAVLAEADSAAPGMAEHIPQIILQPGAYHVRIGGAAAVNEAQLYTLTLSRADYAPPTCPCETGGSSSEVDVFDLLAYLDGWFTQDPGAERTGDEPAQVDVFDLLGYLDCWFPASAGAPCP